MAAVSIDYILDELNEYSLVCWSVKNGKDLLAEQDDPDMNPAQSAELLRRKLTGISNARLTVNLSGVNKASRRGAETFKLRTYTIDNSIQRNSAISMHSPEIEKLHHQILEKEREILSLKYALEKANDTIDQLRKEADEEPEEEGGLFGLSPNIISQATQLITVLSSLTPGKPQPEINGLPETVDKFKSLDKDAEEIIEAICYVCKHQPTSYKMYKNILLSQGQNLKKKHGNL